MKATIFIIFMLFSILIAISWVYLLYSIGTDIANKRYHSYENLKEKEQFRKVINNEHFTGEWWRKKCGFDTVQKTTAKLYILVQKGMVEKIKNNENEVVRYIPTANYCESQIIKILKGENKMKKMYVVRMVDFWDIAGVFDSYEKAKEYSLKLYEKYYNEYADPEYWATPEEALSYFDEVGEIEDFIYFDKIVLNEGKDFDFNSLD